MKYNIIALNGPPGCGKDEAAKILMEAYPNDFVRYSLAEPLKMGLATLLGISIEYLEANKEKYRGELISLSEVWVKPKYGNTHWVVLLHSKLLQNPPPQKNILITDIGFHTEAYYFKRYSDYCTTFTYNFYLIKITRPKHTFANDSRGYIPQPNFTINNYTTLENYKSKLLNLFVPTSLLILDQGQFKGEAI